MYRRLALFTLLLLAGAGCAGGNGSVTGAVTLDGKPLGKAAVSVIASDGNVLAAFSEEDGRYTVPDVPAGPCRLTVTFEEHDQAERDLDIKKGTKTAGKKGRKIPEQYADPDKSGFAVTVVPGQSATLDITMVTK